MANDAGTRGSKDTLENLLADARDTALDQLSAAWLIELERAQEQLARGWREQVERILEERFAELKVGAMEHVREQTGRLRAESETFARREVSNKLNQAARRVRSFENEEEWSRSFVDATEGFCDRAALFIVNGQSLRLAAARGMAQDSRIDNTPLQSAPAFANAIETQDPVVALRTAGELSAPIAEITGEASGERAYLFPISRKDRVAAVLYADSQVDAGALELLASFGSAVLESQEGSPERSGFVSLATSTQPSASMSSWASLSKDDQELHVRAQRFARVQVAEMRLYRASAVKDGRSRRDLYGALRSEIDRAQEEFRREFLSASPTMVDYVHLELLRALANNDVELLGNEYAGPMVQS